LNLILRGNIGMRMVHTLATCFIIVLLLAGVACAQKVLVVTTEQATMPSTNSAIDGEFVVTDLTAAGYPFDVVTYGRYVSMPLDAYDIIVLCGHTSPTAVSSVATKCQQAMAAGKKIFLNGRDCYFRYSTSGALLEQNNFCTLLFPIKNRTGRTLSGAPSIPSAIQKDQSLTSASYGNTTLFTYTFNSQPAMTISLGGYVVGFLYPQGGLIEDSTTVPMYWLDYGKVVSYLRYGTPTVIGFANDRIGGIPIASIEVHCHGDATAIDWLNALTTDCNMPLTNCLVNNTLNSSIITQWNQVSTSNPLMLIGSHSRTHPQDWPSIGVSSAVDQTIGSIADLQKIIPRTENYLTFSGNMNPNTAEIDAMYSGGLIFGAAGYGDRTATLADGSTMFVQCLPTNTTWFRNLSQSAATPYCLSQTLQGDNVIRNLNISYLADTQQKFQANLKYGLYSYGYIHDTYYSPTALGMVGGQLYSTTIRQGIEYLRDQGVKFIDTQSLILRLRDYMAGSISVSFTDSGTATITVNRPGALVNEIKIGASDNAVPGAEGASVFSQHMVGSTLYVTLRPETTSTITVRFQDTPPNPPSVVAPSYSNGNISASWTPASGPWSIVEYQYAVGSSAGGTDVVGWTSAGANTQCNLQNLPLTQGQSYYLSVKDKSSTAKWSDAGVSRAIVADLGTPEVSEVDVAPTAPNNLLISCIAQDQVSGISAYSSGVGTTPQAADIAGWTSPSLQPTIVMGPILLPAGKVYYALAKAKNGAGTWSASAAKSFSVPPFSGGLSPARSYPDDSQVTINEVYVTAIFPDCAYVETGNRATGIKVAASGGLHIGEKLGVNGVLEKPDGERVMTQPSFIPAVPASDLIVKPVGITNKRLGGVSLDAVNPGVDGAMGLYNVGLLVRAWGRVTHSETDFFYIDDGARLKDGSGWTGVRVNRESFTSPAEQTYVAVTGISTILRQLNKNTRCIRLTSAPQILATH